MKVNDHFHSFQYIEAPGVVRTAFLTPALKSGNGTETPLWKCILTDGDETGPWEYLTYLGSDGKTWFVTVHSDYDEISKNIKIWLSHQTSEGLKHDDSNVFIVLDPSGKAMILEIDSQVKDGAAPAFTRIE